MFMLHSSSYPAIIDVHTFGSVGENGIPESEPELVECTTLVRRGEDCVLTEVDRGRAIRFMVPIDDPYVVVYIEWYVPVSFRRTEEDTVRTASYAIHISTS